MEDLSPSHYFWWQATSAAQILAITRTMLLYPQEECLVG